MTDEPSPTAAATRFTDPARMSPAANIPSTVVSKGRRVRGLAGPAGTATSVSTNPSSSHATSAGSQALAGCAPMKQNSPLLGTCVTAPVAVSRKAMESR